jgi:hypothetical protein
MIMKILLEDPVPIRHRRPDLPAGLAAFIHRSGPRSPAPIPERAGDAAGAAAVRQVITNRRRQGAHLACLTIRRVELQKASGWMEAPPFLPPQSPW